MVKLDNVQLYRYIETYSDQMLYIVEYICDYYNFNSEWYVNYTLDYYNRLWRRDYRHIGEDSEDNELKRVRKKAAFKRTLYALREDVYKVYGR